MPQYVVPADPHDLALLSYLHQQTGLWVVIDTPAPGLRGVYGVWRSWRRAKFFADSRGPLATVYFCDGTQFFQAIA